MPELPELEVWKSILAERILNVPIKTVIVKKPMVFRCLIELFKTELFDDLGLEPLTPDFTRERFQNQMRSRRGMIKNVLTNQNFIAGIGNAYADEILFNAVILQLRKASSLSVDEINRLYESIGSVLMEAMQMIRQHLDTDLQLVRCFISFEPKIGNSRLEDFSLFPLAEKFYFHTETPRKQRFTEFAFLFFLRVCSAFSVSPCEN